VGTVQGTCDTQIADVVFVVDSSGSIRDNNPADGSYDNWNKILEFVADIIDQLNIATDGVHVGLVIYSQTARHEFTLNFSTDKTALRTQVLNTAYMGSYTNTSGGIRAMHLEQFTSANGARSGVEQIAIVITDGESNLDSDRTISDAEAARAAGIEIIAVGVTDAVNMAEVSGISSMPQQQDFNYFLIDDFTALSGVVSHISSATCAASVSDVVTDCGSLVADIVFIVDSSGSIRDNNPSDGSYDNWELALNFISDFVADFNLGSGSTGTQFGLVRYSVVGENIFYLNSYYDLPTMQSAILNMGYVGSYTNTSGGIRTANFEQFTSLRGDRSGVPNIAIILTDGVPNLDVDLTVPDAQALSAAGVDVYAVGITNAIDENLLKSISSQPQVLNQNYFIATDFTALSTIEQTIQDSFCTASTPAVVISDNQWCFYTEEEGTICLCIIDECDIQPLNGTQCNNINECADGMNGGCHYSCVDTAGSYYCSCPAGFTVAPDLVGCEDVNECLLNPCAGTTCINTYGSYYCLTSSDVFGGSVAALVGGADVAASSFTTSNVALAAVCGSVGTALVLLIVALAVRRIRTARRMSDNC